MRSTLPILILLLIGCSSATDEPPASEEITESIQASGAVNRDPPPEQDSVVVFFTRDETPFPVRRPSRAAPTDPSARLREALEWLVRGPTPEERAEGIQSWFSAETAGVLREVEVDSGGRAIVDFYDLRPLIPNASTSFGSTMLLQEINGTVFELPEIESAEYTMEGSCDLFWDWLQIGCQPRVDRPRESRSGERSTPNQMGADPSPEVGW